MKDANNDTTLTEAQAALEEATTADEHAIKILSQANCQLATLNANLATISLTKSTTYLKNQLDAKNTAEIENARIEVKRTQDQVRYQLQGLATAIENLKGLQDANQDANNDTTLTEAQAALAKATTADKHAAKILNQANCQLATLKAKKITLLLTDSTTHLQNLLDTDAENTAEAIRIKQTQTEVAQSEVKIAQDQVRYQLQGLAPAIENLKGLQGANNDTTLTEAQAALAKATTAEKHATEVLYQADCQLATLEVKETTVQLTDSTTRLQNLLDAYAKNTAEAIQAIKIVQNQVETDQRVMSTATEELNTLNVTADANAQAALEEAKTAEKHATEALKRANGQLSTTKNHSILGLVLSGVAGVAGVAGVTAIIAWYRPGPRDAYTELPLIPPAP